MHSASEERPQSPQSAFFNPKTIPCANEQGYATPLTVLADQPLERTKAVLPPAPLTVVADQPLERTKSVLPRVLSEAWQEVAERYPEEVGTLPGYPEIADESARDEDLGDWCLPDCYHLGKFLGAGSFGSVREAWNTTEQRVEAVKRIDDVFEHSEHCKRILREVAILSHLKHAHIVEIYDLHKSDDVVYIMMEYCDTDLRKVCRHPEGVTLPQARKLAYGLLVGCCYLHAVGIHHRDLKPANCLAYRDCRVKICDFNLARSIENEQQSNDSGPYQLKRTLTKQVATRWYRPPEVILQLEYTEAIDVWSAGCIIGELFLALNEGGRRPKAEPLFPGVRDPVNSLTMESDGRDDFLWGGDQLDMIFDVLGTPTAEETAALPSEFAREHVSGYMSRKGQGVWSRLPAVAGDGIQLAERMLQLNPHRRPSMEEALQHSFFANVRRSLQEEGVRHGRIDLGIDEGQLDRSASSIPRQLKQEIAEFVPRRSPPSSKAPDPPPPSAYSLPVAC
jgi:serine/threonine protein kinase